MLVQWNRSAAVELYVGTSHFDDGAFSGVHRFVGGKNVASQSKYNHGGDTNWTTLPSLIGDKRPYCVNCCRQYLVAGGDDYPRLHQLLVIPHPVPQSCNQLVVQQVIRRAAVQNREPVNVVVNPLTKSPSKVRDGYSSSLPGGGFALTIAADDATGALSFCDGRVPCA